MQSRHTNLMSGLMSGENLFLFTRIDQSLRSPAGAIGVMQMQPATAKDPNANKF